jgi:predicted  nucleic acid-binding Zn-ribbon protein
LAHEKVTVDEPLISTDVDSLIRTIAERKRVPLPELRQICRIDKKTMDKWIAVLEDEGYIIVEYGLRGTNVLWRDAEDVPAGEKNYRVQGGRSQIQRTEAAPSEPERPMHEPEPFSPSPELAAAQAEDGEVSEAAPAAEAKEQPAAEVNPEFTASEPLDEEPDPEELLSEYLARKRGDAKEGSDDIKSSILTSLRSHDTEDPDAGQKAAEDAPDEPADETNDVEETLASMGKDAEPIEPLESLADEIAKEASAQGRKAPFSPVSIRPSRKERAVDVRELMGSYLEEINHEKSRIEELKKERESLYQDKFATMEGKMQADIVVLTEKIIEKESRISELKERVLELPDKVEELGRLQQQMDALKKEGRDALQRTKAKAEEYISEVGQSRADVAERISKVGSVLDAQSGRVKELEKLSESLDVRSGKIKASLDEARARLDEISSAMDSLAEDMEGVEKMKSEVASISDSIKADVASRGEELKSLEDELSGIERMEHWVQEYIRDYEGKIDDIERYVSKSDDELAELREAAEGLYMKKYLGELENMTDAYQSELHDAVSREKQIETKMAESRARITDLVSDSQAMIKKLKEDAPEATEKDFGVLVAKVKARTARTKNVVEEKQKERAKLSDDSQKTRKTQKPAQKGKFVQKKKAAAKSSAARKGK